MSRDVASGVRYDLPMSVRVRFAPSPTGALHPGSARTVLFNYLFARKHDGSFILRIEDTDQSRSDPASLENILEGIRWLGLDWDEGPEVGGDAGPYFQSQRLDLYRQVVQRLVEAGHAYPCFCTPQRLEQLREEQRRAGKPTRYDRHCLTLTQEEVRARMDAGEKPVIRMKVPDGKTVVSDMVRGDTTFDNATQDDQVLLKSDGFPTYHLASVVDDHEMGISHVIRGDEWLASSPKHVILNRMLGWQPPVFVHLPVVLGPDKAKLSKRHGAASILEFKDMGYLPEAMINFLAFLGWSPGTGDEFFNLDQLVDAFELENIQDSPAVFDQAKLDSVNGQHIRALSVADFAERIARFVPELSPGLRAAAAPLVQSRVQRLTEARGLLDFLVNRPQSIRDEIVPRDKDLAATIAVLRDVRSMFATEELGEAMEPALRQLAQDQGWKPGELFMTLRVALTGTTVTPPLLPSAQLLGRDECLARIDFAIEELVCRQQV
jgi:glutamyl-tRNA synthetase